MINNVKYLQYNINQFYMEPVKLNLKNPDLI